MLPSQALLSCSETQLFSIFCSMFLVGFLLSLIFVCFSYNHVFSGQRHRWVHKVLPPGAGFLYSQWVRTCKRIIPWGTRPATLVLLEGQREQEVPWQGAPPSPPKYQHLSPPQTRHTGRPVTTRRDKGTARVFHRVNSLWVQSRYP